LIFRGFRDIV